MKKVKLIFFIEDNELEKLKIEQNNPYLTSDLPCYELEDGTILYGQSGCPASRDIWWSNTNTFTK